MNRTNDLRGKYLFESKQDKEKEDLQLIKKDGTV